MRLNKTLECRSLLGVRQLVGALVISALLCGLVISATPAPQTQPGSLCESGEKIVFSCKVEIAAKFVSLCSSKELTKDRGYLQYRFGLPGKIELEFPKQRAQTQSAFKYSHYFRAQVDETEISFTRGGHEYTVFDNYRGDQKPVIHRQGVTVMLPNSAKPVSLACVGKATAHYEDLPEAFPEPE